VERAGILVGLMPIATVATAAVVDRHLPAVAQLGGVLVVAAGLALGLGSRSASREPSRGEGRESTA
jgi:drug/metabolite transporter (DMT)-like permease